MNRNPLVSVLVTSHNRAAYIPEALKSVLAQTYQNIEVIIVDDASTDRTVAAVQPFLYDSRVSLYINESNLGQFENRNRAAALAKGEYIKFVDSDDMIYPHCLQVMVDSVTRFPDAGAGISRKPRRNIVFPIQLTPIEAWREAYLGTGSLGNAPNSSIYRREAFNRIGGFPTGPIMSDALLLHRIALYYPIVYMTAGMDWYRVHQQQISNTSLHYNWKMVEPIRYVPQLLFSPECLLPQSEKELIYKNLVGNFIRYTIRLFARGNVSEAIASWQGSALSIKDFRHVFHRLKRPYARNDVSPNDIVFPFGNEVMERLSDRLDSCDS